MNTAVQIFYKKIINIKNIKTMKQIIFFILVFFVATNLVAQETVKIPEMVFVKGGTFQMGSNDGDSNERPVHTVTVSDFYIGKYEITYAEYCEFLNDCDSLDVPNGNYKGTVLYDEYLYAHLEKEGDKWVMDSNFANRPAVHITWFGANEYCNWLSKKTGHTYRLPTEAEWEYAARGGSSSKGYIFSGSDNDNVDKAIWYICNRGKLTTHPVGTKSPNELGIYDMSGNVWEWCMDKYDEHYYIISPKNNPVNTTCYTSCYVIRGGSWDSNLYRCRVTDRTNQCKRTSSRDTGFRVVRVD